MDNIIRIREIELNGFKNVAHGVIQMPSAYDKDYFSHKSDIIGIYGQNGSGKTAVIEAVEFVQSIMMGNALPEDFINYIQNDVSECNVRIGFTVETAKRHALVDYSLSVKSNDDSFTIISESISASEWNGNKFTYMHPLLKYDAEADKEISPQFRYDALVKHDKNNIVNLAVAKRMSQKENSSFIFGNDGKRVFVDNDNPATEDYADIIIGLVNYARMSLFVITSSHSAAISLNLLIPFSFRINHNEHVAKGDLPIMLNGPSVVETESYEIAKEIISDMNIVLCTLIPGMSIELHNYGKQLLENGEEGYRIELLSNRNGTIIPLTYESEGIIKIISILNVFMCVYNSPGMCLVIDELDSGIFEFLLGEILSVIEKGAKGQIIFTSHNLRALEMINKRNLTFATTNPDNRYIHLKNVKHTNNLRDLYLRTITLGGQNEEVYAGTDSVEIGRAFRRVGRKQCDNGK